MSSLPTSWPASSFFRIARARCRRRRPSPPRRTPTRRALRPRTTPRTGRCRGRGASPSATGSRWARSGRTGPDHGVVPVAYEVARDFHAVSGHPLGRVSPPSTCGATASTRTRRRRAGAGTAPGGGGVGDGGRKWDLSVGKANVRRRGRTASAPAQGIRSTWEPEALMNEWSGQSRARLCRTRPVRALGIDDLVLAVHDAASPPKRAKTAGGGLPIRRARAVCASSLTGSASRGCSSGPRA